RARGRSRARDDGVKKMSQDPQQHTAPPAAPAADAPSREAIEAAVVEQLKTVYDPEIPVDIYELGLIYAIEVSDEGDVDIRMTLTSPMCPVAGSLPPEVEAKIALVAGVRTSRV